VARQQVHLHGVRDLELAIERAPRARGAPQLDVLERNVHVLCEAR